MDIFSFILGMAAGFGVAFVVYFFVGLWLAGRMAVAALLITAAPLGAQTVTAVPSPRHSVQIVTTTPITVTVTGGSAQPRDFIGLYVLGQPNYFDWFYVATGTKTKSLKGSPSGTATFMAPRPGQYEAKFWGLTDAGIATLIKAVPLSVIWTAIEVDGAECVVTRKPDGVTDDLSLTIQAGKCTLIASEGAPVKVGDKLVSPGP